MKKDNVPMLFTHYIEAAFMGQKCKKTLNFMSGERSEQFDKMFVTKSNRLLILLSIKHTSCTNKLYILNHIF